MVSKTENGRVLVFTDNDVAFADQAGTPASGWERRPSPVPVLAEEAAAYQSDKLVAWGRFRFDRAATGSGQLAIYTENNRNRLTIYVNGVELYRNYRSENSATFGWNYPYLVPMPGDLLRPGMNEIVLRVESSPGFNLSIGSLWLGAQTELASHYRWQYFWRITGPQVANYTMLFLTVLIFLIWLKRRQDTEYLWLAITGLFWFIRDYHFFAKEPLGDPFLFQQITYYSLYFAVAATFSFCVRFFRMKHGDKIIVFMFGAGLALCVVRVLVLQTSETDLVSNAMTLLLSIGFLMLMIMSWLQSKLPERLAMILTVLFATGMAVHDVGRIPNINWWDGLGFHIQPYTGLFLFIVFLFSLARRYLTAMKAVEQMNVNLERKVKEATSALMSSEKARQELELERVLESERERLMLEMHDGIGSNLVTALTIARENQHPPTTVSTLERALADLKITVDSLAPVDGDVVALLANLRHRLEPDLKRAGVTCVWQAEPCPSLGWLGATSALHMLRIIQEAVSNALTHAGATEIAIGCKAMEVEERAGITLFINDNGTGYQAGKEQSAGRGISNMYARTKAIEGRLIIESAIGSGTYVALWLPLDK